MSKFDTSMGGRQDAFPETAWSVFRTAHQPMSADQHDAFARLCRLYWRPVYKFVRATWHKPVEEAKELTQAFFCDLLEDGQVLLERYRPDQGRFRTYLKAALRTFVAGQFRLDYRQKAGGGRTKLSLDDVGQLESREAVEELKQRTPDELFDRQWARDLLARAIARMKAGLEGEGKGALFAVYDALALRPEEGTRPSHEELARKLGISAYQVNNHFHQAKARLKAEVLEEISRYAASAEDRDQELRDLFGS